MVQECVGASGRFQRVCNAGYKFHLHPVHLGDSLLMFEFFKHYSGQDLATLNMVHQHKKVIHLSYIVLCDGQTINKACLTSAPGVSHLHKFPLQQPTRSDYRLWTTALRRINSESLTLPVPLGKFISRPHLGVKWTTDTDGTILHLELTSDGITRFLIYHPTHATRTRAGHHFVQGNTLVDFPLPFYASVTSCSDTNVLLHSWTEQYVPATLLASFWENIRSMKNPSMWNNLRCNGNGTWIHDGLCMGLLIMVHNGSYMREVSASISAAAVMILCTVTGSICTCTIAEHSASASSY
jgi:hypothetical protein